MGTTAPSYGVRSRLLVTDGLGLGKEFSLSGCMISRVPMTPTSAAATQLTSTRRNETQWGLRSPLPVEADDPSPDAPERASEDSELVCRKYSSGRRFDMRSCYAVTPHHHDPRLKPLILFPRPESHGALSLLTRCKASDTSHHSPVLPRNATKTSIDGENTQAERTPVVETYPEKTLTLIVFLTIYPSPLYPRFVQLDTYESILRKRGH